MNFSKWFNDITYSAWSHLAIFALMCIFLPAVVLSIVLFLRRTFTAGVRHAAYSHYSESSWIVDFGIGFEIAYWLTISQGNTPIHYLAPVVAGFLSLFLSFKLSRICKKHPEWWAGE